MSNPFARPHTTREWLMGSICWTGSCLVVWWLSCTLIDKVLPAANDVLFVFIPGSFCVVHGLIWWRAVAGGRAIIRYDEQHNDFSRTRLVANMWLVALTLFQVACLLGPFILVGWVLVHAAPAVGRFAE